MNRPFLRGLLLGAFLLVLHREARADLRLPTYSEEYPVQTGLIGAALASVVAAAGFLTLKMASDRKARWSITALILIFAGLAAVSYRQLFEFPRKQPGSSGLSMVMRDFDGSPLTRRTTS